MMDDLSLAALKYMTDKAPYEGDLGVYHHYTPRYAELMEPFRQDCRAVLEVGIGEASGEHATACGASLKMWRDYFPRATVHGLDLLDWRAALAGEPRIAAHVGDAGDPAVLARMAALGPFDVVVDDGSHDLEDMRDTCLALYAHATRLYIIEDVHLEWWGARLDAALRPMAGPPTEVLASRTGTERATWVYDKR